MPSNTQSDAGEGEALSLVISFDDFIETLTLVSCLLESSEPAHAHEPEDMIASGQSVQQSRHRSSHVHAPKLRIFHYDRSDCIQIEQVGSAQECFSFFIFSLYRVEGLPTKFMAKLRILNSDDHALLSHGHDISLISHWIFSASPCHVPYLSGYLTDNIFLLE